MHAWSLAESESALTLYPGLAAGSLMLAAPKEAPLLPSTSEPVLGDLGIPGGRSFTGVLVCEHESRHPFTTPPNVQIIC